MRPALILAIVILLTLQSCSSIETFGDRQTRYDLKNYKTYAWIAPGDSVLNRERRDKFFDHLIITSADAELAKKGMTIDVDNPDALFMYDTRVDDQVRYTQSPTLSVGVGVAGPGYYVGGMAPVAGGNITAHNYEQGTLVFTMFDIKDGGTIWYGGAKATIDSSIDMDKTIQTATKHIFIRLPLKVKSK